MKKINKNLPIAFAVVILLLLIGIFSRLGSGGSQNINSQLSESEVVGLTKMREEEKLSRDVYSVLYDKWGVQAFSNIGGSEERHTSQVKTLLDKYNLPDPVKDDTIGIFTDPEMLKLYNQLTEKGLVSVSEALKVGVIIEELDIKDLDEEISKTKNPEIIAVYENLKRGSENHLRAFSNNLEKRGE